MEYNIDDLLKKPFLKTPEAAYVLGLAPKTIQKYHSINGKTGKPHNPNFPEPSHRGRGLLFRTTDILAYGGIIQ